MSERRYTIAEAAFQDNGVCSPDCDAYQLRLLRLSNGAPALLCPIDTSVSHTTGNNNHGCFPHSWKSQDLDTKMLPLGCKKGEEE